MVKVSVRYTGDLHCSAVHEPSRSEIATDAPADNRGKGEAFSPTDLVASALATCMATTMAIAGEKYEVDLKGMTVNVSKGMSSEGSRRIVQLPSEIHLPLPPNHPQRKFLEEAALGCPVHRSLDPAIDRPVQFFWEG